MTGLDGQRPLWVPLAVWLATAALAVALARTHIGLAGGIAVIGGVVFGWLSARREDARVIRIRRRRVRVRSRPAATEGEREGGTA